MPAAVSVPIAVTPGRVSRHVQPLPFGATHAVGPRPRATRTERCSLTNGVGGRNQPLVTVGLLGTEEAVWRRSPRPQALQRPCAYGPGRPAEHERHNRRNSSSLFEKRLQGAVCRLVPTLRDIPSRMLGTGTGPPGKLKPSKS